MTLTLTGYHAPRGGIIPPPPMLTDDRCQDAPGSVAPIAANSPACASEVTSLTPDNPRAVSDRRKLSQPARSSAVVTSMPRISR